MQQDTLVLVGKARRLLNAMGGAIDNNEELKSIDFLELIGACDDVKKHLEDAHQAEYGA